MPLQASATPDPAAAPWDCVSAAALHAPAPSPLLLLCRPADAPPCALRPARPPAAGSSRYCPVSELRALAGSDWQGPSGRSKYDMVAAALDAAAGWEAPQGRSPYDPVSDILAYQPPAGGSSPLTWLLNGWAAGWQQGGAEGGKYAPNLLAAIKGAAPSAQRSKFDPISGGCRGAGGLPAWAGRRGTHCGWRGPGQSLVGAGTCWPAMSRTRNKGPAVP